MPRTIVLELEVSENGKIEIKNTSSPMRKELSPLIGATALSSLNTLGEIRGHNSIGVLVSNPTCFVINGVRYCF